jgi:hypothetical protein
MNDILRKQLDLLVDREKIIDGKSEKEIPDSFSEIVFKKQITVKSNFEIKVIFADYIVKPFPGFDFHDKFNGGIAPPNKKMFGKIIKETEKMYKFDLQSESGSNHWIGWTPKKSVEVYKL